MAIEHQQQERAADAALRRQEAERKQEQDERQIVWVFIWTLFVFKVVTVGALLWYANTGEVRAVIGATTWPWLVIPGAAIAGPLAYRWRLWQLRRRRDALRRSEWMRE